LTIDVSMEKIENLFEQSKLQVKSKKVPIKKKQKEETKFLKGRHGTKIKTSYDE